MTNQKPTIGRVVHYQSYGTPNGEYLPEPRAAIITEVFASCTEVDGPKVSRHENVVSLAVLNPTGVYFNTGVHFAEVPTPGHWNWPPRA